MSGEPGRGRWGGPSGRLFAYRLLSRAYFHLPVLLVFLYLQGHSIGVIEALLAAHGVSMLLSGPLVRRITAALGPVAALRIGEAAKAVGLILLSQARPGDVLLPLLGQVINGGGFALTSSVENTLAAKFEPDADRRSRLQAATQSWIFGVVLVSGLAGAVLFQDSPRLVFLLSAVASGLSLLLTLSLPAVPAEAPQAASPAAAARPALRAWGWALYYVIVRSVTLGSFIGLLPLLLYVDLKLSLPVFGLLLALFNVAAFLVARYLGLLLARGRQVGLFVATTGLLCASLLLLATRSDVPSVSVAIALLGLGSGAARPLTLQGLESVPEADRQWLYPRLERFTGAGVSALVIVIGLGLSAVSTQTLLFSFGAAVLGAGLLLARVMAASPAPVLSEKGGKS